MEDNTAIETTTQEDQTGIGSIITDAFKENQAAPEVSTETEEVKEEEKALETEEAPFLELLIDEAKKIPFKTEEEFTAFLERNKVLKEGWLRQSDYTQKTMALSDERKKFEKQLEEDKRIWGEALPDPASKQALAGLWQVYQRVQDPLISNAIDQFVTDVNLLAKGQAPVGPLAEVIGSEAKGSPELIELRRHNLLLQQRLDRFENTMSQKEQETKNQLELQAQEKADRDVSEWISKKQNEKINVDSDAFREEEAVMADLYREDEKGKALFTLDELHTMARAHLGRTEADIARKVIKDAKTQGAKSSKGPVSKGSSSEEPEPKNIKEIFAQAIKET